MRDVMIDHANDPIVRRETIALTLHDLVNCRGEVDVEAGTLGVVEPRCHDLLADRLGGRLVRFENGLTVRVGLRSLCILHEHIVERNAPGFLHTLKGK